MNPLAIGRLSPRIELRDIIKDIWMFESNGRLAEAEKQIIPPNGSVKLLLYYKGDYAASRVGDQAFPMPRHRLFVAGVSDGPSIANFDRGKPFGCISIELHPAAAYRLFAVPLHELRNIILPIGDLIGAPAARNLEEWIYEAPNPAYKAALLQEYLIGALARTERDAAFEYGTAAIMASRGLVSMAALANETGRSDRWLRAKFEERLGISPKTFASIVRFQSCYRALLQDKRGFLQGGHFHDLYYDQAHFIKEFKRFMGHSPARYAALQNQVGEIIYI